MIKKAYGLRIKVLVFIGVFAAMVIAGALFSAHTLKTSQQNYRLLGEIKQLEEAIGALKRSGQNYLDNPARDYQTYNRDIEVFLKEILGDVDDFDRRLQQLRDDFAASSGEIVPAWAQGWLGAGHADIEGLLDAVTGTWQSIEQEFFSQLGDADNDPRLEWGAEHLVATVPEFSGEVMQMTDQYRSFLDAQQRDAEAILTGIALAIILASLLGLVWFYTRVIRRIGGVVDACARVARGDFGYALKVDGDDEISVLARAFNTLSSRSQLVMAMLSDLQQAQSVEQALQSIVQASGSYLPVAWVGLMQREDRGQSAQLTHALPAGSLSPLGARVVTSEDPLGKALADALIAGEPLLINDVRQRALAGAEHQFLRELVRTTQIESLVVLPLSSGSGWNGYVLFGSRRASYRPDQVELLKNLAPTTAMSLQRIITGRTTPAPRTDEATRIRSS